MDNTEIQELFLDYLDRPETEHAFFVTGKWGSGKTYLWKNHLAKIARDRGKIPIYVSLFGLSSISEIQADLWAEIILSSKSGKFIKEKLFNYVSESSVKEFIGSFKSLSIKWSRNVDPRLMLSPLKHIICLDDIERLAMPIKNALGYVSSLCEGKNIKVIILGNKERVGDVNFDSYREKIIGKTYTHKPDLTDVIPAIIYSYDVSYRDFLRNNLKTIYDAYTRSGQFNIRILKNAIYGFSKPFLRLYHEQVAGVDVLSQVFYTYLVFYIENALVNIDDWTHLDKIGNSSANDFFQLAMMSRMKKEHEEDDYFTIFSDKYFHQLEFNIFVSRAIWKYICTGILNYGDLKVEIISHFRPTKTEEDVKTETFITDFYKLSQDDFEYIARRLIGKLSGGEFQSVSEYVGVAHSLIYKQNEGLVDISPEAIISSFKNGVLKANEEGRLVYDPKRPVDSSIELDLSRASQNLLKQTLDELIEQLNKENSAVGHERFLVSLDSNIDEAIGFLDSIRTEVFLNRLDPQRFASIISSHSSEDMMKMYFTIRARYSFANIRDFFTAETENIKKISDELSGLLGELNGLNRWSCTKLRDLFASVHDRLSGDKANKED